MSGLSLCLLILYVINFILLVTVVFFEHRDPVVSIAWVLCFIALPGLGLILFMVFGVGLKRHTRKQYEQKLINAANSDTRLTDKLNTDDSNIPNKKYTGLIHYLRNTAHSPITQNNTIKIFTSARDKYASVLEDINNAKKNIHLLYFIIRDDDIGNKIVDALAKKASQGVEVRFLYDGFGSILTNPRIFEKLKNIPNAHVAEFFPVKLFSVSKINHRNHRKIIIIDGKISYLGGMNIGDEYMGFGKPSPWRDTHMRIEGEASLQIQKYFCLDWEFSTKEILSKKTDSLFHNSFQASDNLNIQIVASGPESAEDEIKSGILKMINSAEKYIYIQTPYFVPDASVLCALCLAVKSGVEVKLMIPGIPDKKYVYHNTMSYAYDILKAGAKVYQYPGFIHSKTIVCDDDISTIGTTNIDSRSFTLHFEMNAFIYDNATAELNRSIFQNDLELCKEITEKSYAERKKRHPLSYMADGFFRLFSPLM